MDAGQSISARNNALYLTPRMSATIYAVFTLCTVRLSTQAYQHAIDSVLRLLQAEGRDAKVPTILFGRNGQYTRTEEREHITPHEFAEIMRRRSPRGIRTGVAEVRRLACTHCALVYPDTMPLSPDFHVQLAWDRRHSTNVERNRYVRDCALHPYTPAQLERYSLTMHPY